MSTSDPELPHIERQREVFERALEIHAQHSGTRNIFEQSGWMGALVDIHKKFDRVWAQFWNQHPDGEISGEDVIDLDDAYDLINYTGFFIQQVMIGNRNGEWNWDNE